MMKSCVAAEAALAAVGTADVEAMSRDQLAAHNGDLKRLRSWLGAAEVRAARQAKTLEASGCCESVESMRRVTVAVAEERSDLDPAQFATECAAGAKASPIELVERILLTGDNRQPAQYAADQS